MMEPVKRAQSAKEALLLMVVTSKWLMRLSLPLQIWLLLLRRNLQLKKKRKKKTMHSSHSQHSKQSPRALVSLIRYSLPMILTQRSFLSSQRKSVKPCLLLYKCSFSNTEQRKNEYANNSSLAR